MVYPVDFIVSNEILDATKLAKKSAQRRLMISRGQVSKECRMQEGKTPTVFVARELEPLLAFSQMNIHMIALM